MKSNPIQNTIFQESDLQFAFATPPWQVKRYDTHRYYKILSGAGLKGVDFLGILNQQQLVFIEVKNFRTHHPTKSPSYLIFEDQAAFIKHIADKLEDTNRAINVVIAYLQRKWWYRTFLKVKWLIPKKLVQNRDWYFWYQAHQFLPFKQKQVLVLWLEIARELSPTAKEKLKIAVDQQLELDLYDFVGEVVVADRKAPVFSEYLSVSVA